MGGSSSKSTTTNKYNTNVVNNSDLKLLNENVNNFIAETVVNQASNCSANISQLQNVNFSHITTEGDFTISDVNQTQKAALTFDCVQLSAFQNDIANGVLTQYTDAIKNSYDTSAISKMTSAAKTNSQSQFGTTGSSNTSSDSNNEFNFNSTTNVNEDIQNIVKNAITNNMSLNDIQECIAIVKNSQNISFSDINAGGNLTVKALSQTQAADLYSKCIQEKNNGSKISNQIAADLGLTVTTEATNTSSAEMESTSLSESSNVGVLQSAGEGIASVFKGVGQMWGTIIGSFGFGGTNSDMSLYCCIAIIILAIVGGLGYYMMTQEDGQDSKNHHKNSNRHHNKHRRRNDRDDANNRDYDGQSGGENALKFNGLRCIIIIVVIILIFQIYNKQN